jgi:hypothetical protein
MELFLSSHMTDQWFAKKHHKKWKSFTCIELILRAGNVADTEGRSIL